MLEFGYNEWFNQLIEKLISSFSLIFIFYLCLFIFAFVFISLTKLISFKIMASIINKVPLAKINSNSSDEKPNAKPKDIHNKSQIINGITGIKRLQNTNKDSSQSNKETVKNKSNNMELRVPGSNWEIYKSIVTAEAKVNKLTEDKSQNLQTVKRRRKRHKKYPPISSQALENNQNTKSNEEVKNSDENDASLTRIVAIDCEMVGIGDGQESMLARISIVNFKGVCVYDKYVKPRTVVVDYRTEVSGIRAHQLKAGEDFYIVQKEVYDILKGRILVGHAIQNDLAVLFLSHPKKMIRDTSRYKPFRKFSGGGTPSLKKLASELLGMDIQSGEHNSVEDARAALQIYKLFRKQWELSLRSKR